MHTHRTSYTHHTPFSAALPTAHPDPGALTAEQLSALDFYETTLNQFASQYRQPFSRQHPHELQPLIDDHPAAQHLGVTDPFIWALLQRYPALGDLRPFRTGDVTWTLIHDVVIWDQGGQTYRTEHDPDFAHTLVRSYPNPCPGHYTVRSALISLQTHSPLLALHRELAALTWIGVTDLRPFYQGGLRAGALRRALLPGGNADVRAALGTFLKTCGHRFLDEGSSRLAQHLDLSRLLIQCGDLSGAATYLRNVHTSKYLNHETPLEDLPVMQRSGQYDPQIRALIDDTYALLRDLLVRQDLWKLNLTAEQLAQPWQALHDTLNDLPEDTVLRATKKTLKEAGLATDEVSLRNVDPQREGQFTWENGAHCYEITAAATSEELQREGQRLRHCVGSSFYTAAAISGSSELYFIRPTDPQRPGLEPSEQDSRGLTAEVIGNRIRQISGHRNSNPTGPGLIAAQLWARHAGLSGHWPDSPLPDATVTPPTSPQRDRQVRLITGNADTIRIREVHLQVRQKALKGARLTEAAAQAREQALRTLILRRAEQAERILNAPPLNPLRLPRRGQQYLLRGRWLSHGQYLTRTINGQYHNGILTLRLTGQKLETDHVIRLTSATNRLILSPEVTPLGIPEALRPGAQALLRAAGHTGPVPQDAKELLAALSGAGNLNVTLDLGPEGEEQRPEASTPLSAPSEPRSGAALLNTATP